MPSRKGEPGRRRLSSLSLPVVGGGAGWTTEPGEREVVRELFGDLGALRVLSFPIEMEGEEYVNQSVLNIRDHLTATLKQLPESSASATNIRGMRDACNEYLQATPGPQGYHRMRKHFEEALIRWREIVYEDIKALAYGLDLEDAHRLLQEMRSRFG